MIDEAQKDDIIRVVREILAEKDNHAILFDPILVEADVDHDGDEYLITLAALKTLLKPSRGSP